MSPLARITSALVTCSILAAPLAIAQHHDQHGTEHGSVSFETSCTPEAEARFHTGLALLHHMMYDQAEPHFEAAAEDDPDCAIAHWGVAMTQLNPLWAPSTSAQVDRAREAISRARALNTSTDRERMHIEAVAAYFDGGDVPNRDRLARWEAGQRDLHMVFPDDTDAAAFYALSLLATAPRDDQTFAQQAEAGSLLERLHAENPEHPGLFHYIIHAYDNPVLAMRGVEVANAYDQVAPNVPHALHMPSHIFVRLGKWPETIAWNRRSADAAFEQPVDGRTSMHHVHALDYLMYAYLQQGQDESASRILREIESVDRYQGVGAAAYGLAAAPARFALEREAWSEAAALPARQRVELEWDRFPAYESITYFARGLGAARSGDLDAARAAHERIDELYDATIASGDTYWATLVDAQRKSVAAWIALSAGRDQDALALMRAAADLEDSVDKAPVTPSEVLPARELLGDMLLEMDRPVEAREAYLAALEISPNRLRSHYGVARSSEIIGDRDQAHEHYQHLTTFATGSRSSIERAVAYLGRD